MLDKLLKNIVPVIIGLGVFVILTFIFILILTGRDPETYVGSISNLIGVFVSSGLLAALLSRIGKNVNGNTSKLLEENRTLRTMVGVGTDTVTIQRTGDEYAPELMSEDTIQRITDQKDKLPSHRG